MLKLFQNKMNRFRKFHECLELRDGMLVTVNLQHLYTARNHRGLREILQDRSGKVHLCVDGRGARLLFKVSGLGDAPLVVGNLLVERYLETAAGRHVLVVGSSDEVKTLIVRKYPYARFEWLTERVDVSSEDGMLRAVQVVSGHLVQRYDAVFLALGVPKQELLAYAILRRGAGPPILCVGGSFEMIAGVRKRAPAIISLLGLEGLWRLLMEPGRMRLLRAVRTYANFVKFLCRPADIRRMFADDQA